MSDVTADEANSHDTIRPPVQEQIDQLAREFVRFNAELGFCMRYCRAAAQAMGARAAIAAIDDDRDRWQRENGYESIEDTKPGHRQAVD